MRQSQQAFTLIELMVVMAIMTVMFSLIGPLAQNQVEKLKAADELAEFSRFLRSESALAFFSGQPRQLDLNSNQVSVFVNEQLATSKTFKQLTFVQNSIVFNANGFPSSNMVELIVRNQKQQVKTVSATTRIVEGR